MTPEKMPELPAANAWLVHGQYDGRPDLGPQVFYYYGGVGKTHVEAHALHGDKCEPVYTATQLRAYGELCRQGEAKCHWTIDDEWTWHGACGATWAFTEDGPAENNYHYCHGCGKPLDTARTKEARDEG